MSQQYLTHLHQEHQQWIHELSFYEEDISIMRKRLEEIASRNTGKDMHAMIERFQNKIIIQQEQIDILLHDINECESHLIKNVEENPVATDRRKMEDHTELRERVQTFELLFNRLRKDLNTFVATWM